MRDNIKVALIGNPNVGKTSLFNALTGLNHKIGNYPGITVDKKTGSSVLDANHTALILDLPGTYSIHASSLDEKIALEVLLDKQGADYPDVVVVVAQVTNLKRNLLLFTQVKDLGIPCVLAINMADQMQKFAIELDLVELEKQLQTKVVLLSAKTSEGLSELKQAIVDYKTSFSSPCLDISRVDPGFFSKLQQSFDTQNIFRLWMIYSCQYSLPEISYKSIQDKVGALSQSQIKGYQQKLTIYRYQYIGKVLKTCFKQNKSQATDFRSKLDRILTHKFWGYAIFLVIMLIVFQAIFQWSAIPMEAIEDLFSSLSVWVEQVMPPGKLTQLIAQGIIPGIGGIMPFIPQIAILFLFISILEESGYMSRVVFIMDRVMKPFGLNGKSVVPLISGNACAIPAILAARNIEDPKQRLLTILVTPFTTCSARLPVYIIIIALVIPDKQILGFISLQGLTLGAFYLIGFLMALISAWVLSKFVQTKYKSYFIIEMPDYSLPMFKNVLSSMYENTKAFVVGAGKIIFMLSIVIWFLGAHGPGENYKNASEIVSKELKGENLSQEEIQDHIASYKLENSYIGIIGKSIEPVIKPLGYDWKIGIAVLSSFVAREVFVGTLATIYNVESAADEQESIMHKMSEQTWPGTQNKVFNLASGMSLLFFYAFAMQCSSTLAITYRETKSWKWTVFQLVFMTVLAYISALLVYQFLK